jgi:hypothetical protein
MAHRLPARLAFAATADEASRLRELAEAGSRTPSQELRRMLRLYLQNEKGTPGVKAERPGSSVNRAPSDANLTD